MRILQVGLGSMGKRRIRNMQALGGHEFMAFDPRADRREEATRLYGVPTVETFEAGMQWQPDSIVISTPPDYHYAFCKAAAEGRKHWFCEANILSVGARELASLAKRHNIVGAPSCTMRFHPIYQELRGMLADGSGGKPLLLTFHLGQYLPDWHPWEGLNFYGGRKETGAGREMVPFEFEWMQWLFGRVSDVQATHAAQWRFPSGVDDVYAIIARFESGLIASVVIDVVAREVVREGKLLLKEGSITWDLVKRTLHSYDGASKTVRDLDPCGSGFSIETIYMEEMSTFVRACAGEVLWPHSYEDDLHLEHVLTASERSQAEGRRVSIAEMAD